MLHIVVRALDAAAPHGGQSAVKVPNYEDATPTHQGNYRLRLAVESAGIILTRPSSTTGDNDNTFLNSKSSCEKLLFVRLKGTPNYP
ncbi:hypothetical protein E4T56_gene1691 [Termitomyces sp. T112]|nr:hypothetical protein E4T56_gene1691 [Termitomyces sp. T112]